MTEDEFEKLLRHSPCEEFVAAVNLLDEKARKPLHSIVKSVRKELESKDGPMSAISAVSDMEKKQADRKKWLARNPYVETNLALGALACGSAADAHRVALWQVRGDRDNYLSSILLARKPGWLASWVDKQLAGEFPQLSWELLRALIEAGAIEKPQSAGYTTVFINAMRGYAYREPDSYVRTSDRLIAEPGLLEDEVWRLFEGENHAFTTDWHAKSNTAPKDYETWPDAIVRLAELGHIDRNRLLDVTLKAMHGDIKQNQLAAYGKLHDALKPNDEELKARESEYLALLVSPASVVVGFAIKMLAILQRRKMLDAAAFLDSAPPVLAHKTKGSAMQALRILAAIPLEESMEEKAAAIAIAAMAHPSVDVQDEALNRVEKFIAGADDDLKSRVERQTQFLAARLQPRAKALLGAASVASKQSQSSSARSPALASDFESLTSVQRRLGGFADPHGESVPAPLDYALHDLPNLANREPLALVASQDELLELAARLIETVESADQVEVLIDGIARFGPGRSPNFRKLADPLVQRVTTGQTSSAGLTAGWNAVCVSLVDLVLTWLTGTHYDSRSNKYYREAPRDAFQIARLREIQGNLLRGISMPLLATPSYAGSGWIDPKDLAQRLVQLDGGGQTALATDLMQALLRSAPGDRKNALAMLSGIKGNLARIVRFALGSDDSPTRKDASHAGIWLCAAKARGLKEPLKKLLAPVAHAIPDLPDLLEPAEWQWSVRIERNEKHKFKRTHLSLETGHTIEYDAEASTDSGWLARLRNRKDRVQWQDWPLAAMHAKPSKRWYGYFQVGSAWHIEWMAMQQPVSLESYFSIAAEHLAFRIDEGTSREMPIHAFLTALCDSSRPWHDMARLAVCLGLLSRSPDSSGFVVDALIPAIESGHADVYSMASVLAKLLDNDAFKVNRFEQAMGPVLEQSSFHRWWTGRLVAEIVARMPSLPKGVHHLYTVALECMIPLQLRPNGSMAARLREHSGSSKSAKLAKALLALEGIPIDEPPANLVSEAVRYRLRFVSGFAG